MRQRVGAEFHTLVRGLVPATRGVTLLDEYYQPSVNRPLVFL